MKGTIQRDEDGRRFFYYGGKNKYYIDYVDANGNPVRDDENVDDRQEKPDERVRAGQDVGR